MLGIGTTSPSVKLHVNGNTLIDVGYRLQLWNDNVGVYRDSNDLMLAGFGNVVIKSSATTMTAQTERMRITSTGNVGIGTTSPTQGKFVVAGNALFSTSGNDNSGGFRIDQLGTNTSARTIWYNGTGSNTNAIVRGEGDSYFNGGNVGIGTTSPIYKLDVDCGTENQSALFRSTDVQNSIGLTDSGTTLVTSVGVGVVGNDMYLYAGSTSYQQRLRIQGSTGNVGIGTTTPAAKLDVNGGIRMADDATAASATNVGTLRYRADANNSYVDMCMQTGAATYAWVNIVQNNW